MAESSIGFMANNNNNNLRPYSVGMSSHEDTIATILLYNEGTQNEQKKEDKKTKNFLLDLNEKVKTLEPGQYPLTSGQSDVPSGTIAVVPLDGRNQYYGVFNNFSLLSVAESSEEILKVNINFGSHWNAFFFGQQPKVYRFTGFFLDSREYPYYQEFMVAYDNYLSGRKLIENKMMTKFVYDGRIVDGYMINLAVTSTSEAPLIKSFQFSVLVRRTYWIRDNIIPKRSVAAIGREIEDDGGLNLMSNRFRIPEQIYKGTVDFNQSDEETEAKIAAGLVRNRPLNY